MHTLSDIISLFSVLLAENLAENNKKMFVIRRISYFLIVLLMHRLQFVHSTHRIGKLVWLNRKSALGAMDILSSWSTQSSPWLIQRCQPGDECQTARCLKFNLKSYKIYDRDKMSVQFCFCLYFIFFVFIFVVESHKCDKFQSPLCWSHRYASRDKLLLTNCIN